ncbi:uncharacterized protein PgNI_09680 [Pyricularia grisea]|uniref:Uncharacterized protein n=1 Tax=Pyricularia grisea TaxID=148305 RepID=A0A6P8ARC5_PYRGI|nr:uncharacterized protein PgNI_09680 [Pyricularia grisea]TLD04679.1 hypothetical protein PgNI_09680 [Pyricularia grisea]
MSLRDIEPEISPPICITLGDQGLYVRHPYRVAYRHLDASNMSRYDREDEGYFRHDRYASNNGSGHLQPPSSHQRPRSMPPVPSELVRGGGGGAPLMSSASTRYVSRSRSRTRRSISRSRSRSRDRNRGHHHHHHHHNPIDQAEHALKHTFTSSNSGIGVGILGAVVGGLAARHITEASSSSSSRQGHHHHHHGGSSSSQQEKKEHEARLLVSTLVGAAVGGLGANALERRIEHNRDRKIEREEEWRGRDRRVAGRRSRPSPREGLNSDYYRDHPASPDFERDHVYDDRGPRRKLDYY